MPQLQGFTPLNRGNYLPFTGNYLPFTGQGVIPSPATQTNPGQTIGAGAVQAPPSATAPPVNPTSWGPLERGAMPSSDLNSGNGANTAPNSDGASSSGGLAPFQPATLTPPSSGAGGLAGAGINTPGGAGGVGGNFLSLDDGGSVDDGSSGTPSLDDALSTIQQTLDYGRQKSGIDTGAQGSGAQGSSDTQGGGQSGVIPGGFANNWQTMRPSTNVQDEQDSSGVGQSNGPQPKMGPSYTLSGPVPQQTPTGYPYGPQIGMQGAPGAFGRTTGASQIMGEPNQGYDDGGDVDAPSSGGMPAQPQTNQPTPQPGQVKAQQNPRSLVGYAMGSDAVTPDIAQAMEAKVDPQGQMDGTTRKMLAIASAPDQQTQWGMMQHYRQKFNAYSAFARAAAQGTPQKPADLGAATQAANAAFENVPDGTQTTFQPHQGGVVAHVKHLTGGKSQQGFDDGGNVSADETGIPSYDPSQDQDTSTPGEGKGATNTFGAIKGDTTSNQTDQGSQQDTSVPMTTQQFTDLLAKMPYDKIMDHGAADTVQQIINAGGQVSGMTPQGVPILQTKQPLGVTPPPTPTKQAPAIDPEITRQADALGLQGEQRTKFLMDQMGGTRTQKNALELQEEKNKPWVGKIQSLNDRNANNNATKLQIAQMQEGQRAIASGQRDMTSIANSIRSNVPGTSNDDAMKAAINSMRAMRQNGGQSQAPQQPAQGQQPQQAPAPEQRMVGSIYMTPKGPAKWMGQGLGWQVGQ